MNADALEILFYCAGLALAVHVAASACLKWQLQGEDELLRKLFLAPNAWLGNKSSTQLRARYFIPWADHPEEVDDYSLSIRSSFMLARIAGGAFPLLMLAFFVTAVYVGVHQ